MKRKCILVLLLAVFAIMLLYGCSGDQQPQVTTEPVETTLAKYTVTFTADGKTHAIQEIVEGDYASSEEPKIQGTVFYGWVDKKGNAVDPSAQAVHADANYTAVLFPDLSAHEPYLFTDKNRFLYPDTQLTNDELSVAINILAVPGAEAYLPQLPEGADAVTPEALEDLLRQLFPEEAVTDAMAETETVTRAAFAGIMNRLLGRTEENAVADENAALPYDTSPARQDIAVLMEACLHHSHPDDSGTWSQIALELKNPAGFFNLDGWLYCVDDEGTLVRDTSLGVLQFGSDGRYTCGDQELDVLVAGILDQILRDNPGAERIDLLRRAFEYSRDSFQYLRRSAYYFGETGWEIEDAKKMITTGRGNCYSYAAVFWALGRGLGYETIGISGTMTKTDQPHSWVEIFFDGVPYVFDPEMEMVYRFERDIFDKDMFMVTYEAGKYWNYKRP